MGVTSVAPKPLHGMAFPFPASAMLRTPTPQPLFSLVHPRRTRSLLKAIAGLKNSDCT